jgi:beta-glucosidase
MALPAFAEAGTIAVPYEKKITQVAASGDQVAIEAHVKGIIEADGLQFKDLNGNGKLDVYENWRANVDDRVNDLLSQMTLDEKIGSLFHASTGGTFTSLYPYTDEFLYSNENTITVQGADAGGGGIVTKASTAGTTYIPMYHSIISDNVTTYLHNVNGMPEDLLTENNIFQEIGESGRLGIPIVLSCDRSYNTWAGMVNMANYAFGVAHDQKLLYDLVAQYAKEERALGFHVPFHGYGEEIGSWYGDDVNYIAQMAGTETKAYEENGVNACTKHFVARGGRSSYINAKSPANLVDSWMVGWKAAVDAGTSWVMLNNNHFLNDCNVCYDSESMSVLRNDLGYDGCVVTDWPMWMSVPSASGITPDGKDLSKMTVGELYTTIFNADVDQIGCFFLVDGTDTSQEFLDANYPGTMQAMWPDAIKQEIDKGNLSIETIDRHVRRVLKNKFELGLFEDPYGSMDEVLNLCASDAYKADQFELTTIDDIYAARKDSTNEMETRLQTESSVLMKNDSNILPLTKGTKAYVTGSSEDTTALDAAAIGTYATVVKTMDEADVIIARVTAMDDSTEAIIEDANAAGKPIVLVVEGSNGSSYVEPDTYAAEHCNAILMLTYNAQPDHGSSMGNFFTHTLSSVLADMLFGEKEPSGSLVFEIARNAQDATLDWGELQLDTGVDTQTRLYMAATVRQNPTTDLPDNLGDVLYPNGFGMRYGQDAAISLNTLVMDQEVVETEQEVRGTMTKVNVAANKTVKSGEPFSIYMIAENAGADGNVIAAAYEGDALLASKFVSVKGGSFCVVPMTVTLEGAGEHTITAGDQSLTVTVE